jgi:hypothetical protein
MAPSIRTRIDDKTAGRYRADHDYQRQRSEQLIWKFVHRC